MPYYIVICGLSGSTVLSYYFINGTFLEKNLIEIRSMNEEMQPLNPGFQYSIEQPLAVYFTNLVTEINNAIKLLDAKMHNAYYISANKNLKQILNSNNSYNISHERRLCIIKQLKQKLVTKNAVLVPVDKGTTTVDTDTKTYIEKVQPFLAVNVFPTLPKDPTENCQKLIHKTQQQCSTFINTN
jgi:hypothetical protein